MKSFECADILPANPCEFVNFACRARGCYVIYTLHGKRGRWVVGSLDFPVYFARHGVVIVISRIQHHNSLVIAIINTTSEP